MKKFLFGLVGAFVSLFVSPSWAADLPDGYTQLEYLQNTTSGPYIDTGVLVDTNYAVEAKMNIQNTGYAFWGDNADYQGIRKFNLFIATTSGNSGWGSYASSNRTQLGVSLNTDFIVKENSSGIWINDVKKVTYTPITATSQYSFYLFRGNGTQYTSGALSKIYYFKMYQNDVLVHYYVPAKRNSDGAIGMYDTVSGTFFANAGTGSFVAGPVAEIKIATTKFVESQFNPIDSALASARDVVNTVVTNTINQAASIATLHASKQTRPADDSECPAGKKCLLVTDENDVPHWYEIIEPVLPDGYTALEYIDGGNLSYIDTGKRFQSSYTYEFSYKATTTTNTAFLGTANTNSGTGAYSWDFVVNSTGFFYPKSETESTRVTISDVDRDAWHTYKFNGTNALAIYDTSNVWQISLLTTDWESSGNIYLFKSNRAGNATGSAMVSIKYFVVRDENGTLIQNLIPARRNSDGAIGMYDTVSGTFFTNAGTGTFVAGPVVD